MFCPYCGHNVGEVVKFCGSCGKHIEFLAFVDNSKYFTNNILKKGCLNQFTKLPFGCLQFIYI